MNRFEKILSIGFKIVIRPQDMQQQQKWREKKQMDYLNIASMNSMYTCV